MGGTGLRTVLGLVRLVGEPSVSPASSAAAVTGVRSIVVAAWRRQPCSFAWLQKVMWFLQQEREVDLGARGQQHNHAFYLLKTCVCASVSA